MRAEIRFLLGSQELVLRDFPATQTVLRYLREDMGRCGSKEGCAEGDCGACTVVVGELAADGNRIAYQAINACIALLGSLDGKQLITVEDLRGPNGALHPVQQFMVDNHGSQCGFCTPGIVMSLFALQHGAQGADEQQITDALAGNLCRCTGYGPILESGRQAVATPVCDGFDSPANRKRLQSIAADDPVEVRHGEQHFFAPTDSSQLCGLMAEHPDAVLVAGCTDVGLWVTKQHRDIDTLIYLGNIKTLREMNEQRGSLQIGAMVTYSQALQCIAGHYPDFAEMIRVLGGLQVRNVGTIGGNIANGSPIGDTPPVLIALGATVCLRSSSGVREIALEDFYIDYGQQDLRRGEFLESVRLPLPKPGWRLCCYKVSKRREQDISAVSAAFHVHLSNDGPTRQVTEIRVAYGGMAGIPKRAMALEKALLGQAWNSAAVTPLLDALDEDFTPLSDLRASADYRREVARNLVLRCVLETGQDAACVRLFPALEAARVAS